MRKFHPGLLISIVFVLLLGLPLQAAAPFSDDSLGAISGTIYESDGITPITDATLILYDAINYITTGYSDFNGEYLLEDLVPGDYYLLVQKEGFSAQVYQDAGSRMDGTPITVTAGTITPDIDVLLGAESVVTGTVYEADGVTPLADAWVSVYHQHAMTYGYVDSDENGNYEIRGLARGNYIAYAIKDGYLLEHYLNQPDGTNATQFIVADGVTTSGIDFTLEQGSFISGRVYEDDGVTPIANANVFVFAQDGSQLANGYTAADGTYTTTSPVPAGTYTVMAAANNYAQEYYNNKPNRATADPVITTSGNDVSDIDFTLDPPAVIAGHVYESDGVTPIFGVQIYLTDYETGAYAGYASSGLDGAYSFPASTGTYRLYAYSNAYIPKYYNNKLLSEDADPVSATNGTTTSGIDFLLDTGGTLSGTVYQPDGVTPAANTSLELYRQGDTYASYYAYTDASGNYAFTEWSYIESGSYRLRAYSSTLGSVYYNQKPTLQTADLINIPYNADLTGYNLTFFPPGAISGMITATDSGGGGGAAGGLERAFVPGSPVGGEQVFDFHSAFEAQRGESYNDYLARQLRTGQTILQDPLSLIAPEFTRLVFQNETERPPSWSMSSMPLAGGSSRLSIEDGTVFAQHAETYQYYSTDVNPDGSYLLSNLPAGRYKVGAYAPGYTQEYFNDYYQEYYAPAVTVAGGTTVSDIDIALDPAGTVTGTVYAADGVTPLQDQGVFWSTNFQSGTMRCTDASGNYTLPDVPTNVVFVIGVNGSNDCNGNPSSYVAEYWEETSNYNLATPLAFSQGVMTLNDIDFMMETGGRISGVVYYPDGVTPMQYAYISILDAVTGSSVASAGTNANGEYVSSVLPTGGYKVYLSGSYGYASEYYDNATSLATATVVNVTAGSTTPNINFTAESVTGGSGSISGVVYAPDGVTPVQNVEIQLYRPEQVGTGTSYYWVSSTTSNFNGQYTFDNLAPNSYVLEASPENYITEFYQDKSNFSDANLIAVSNSAVTGINFVLNSGVIVTGTIFDENSGLPVPYPNVSVYAPNGSYISNATTYSDGTYRVVVPPGTYTVSAGSYPYGASRYYGNVVTLYEASTFNAVIDPVTGINVTIGRYGEIVGTVYEEDGTTPIGSRYINVQPQGLSYSYAYCTNANGVYRATSAFVGVANIVYTTRSCDSAQNYVPEWWQEMPNPAGATPVNLTNSQRFQMEVDFTLDTGGTISGVVYQSDGVTPISGATVTAYQYINNNFIYYDGAATDAAGTYQIRNLGTDDYLIYAYAPNTMGEYYQDTLFVNDADPVSVVAGNDTPNINFTLSSLTESATINGSVTLQGRPAQPHATWSVPLHVVITPVGGGASVFNGTVTTDQSGDFTIPGMPLGEYRIRVKHPHTLANAVTVTLMSGQNSVDMGLLREGDANDDNQVVLVDFSILAGSFAKQSGDVGYDARADFNLDNQVTLTDFSLLAGNFAQTGATP